MRLPFFVLTSLILLLACRAPKKISQHKLLTYKIYDLERGNYTTYYRGEKITPFRRIVLDSENILSVDIDNRERKIFITPKKTDTKFIYVSDILDSIQRVTGQRDYMMAYNGVPYLRQDIDSFRIEKTLYRGYIVLKQYERAGAFVRRSGKLLFRLR